MGFCCRVRQHFLLLPGSRNVRNIRNRPGEVFELQPWPADWCKSSSAGGQTMRFECKSPQVRLHVLLSDTVSASSQVLFVVRFSFLLQLSFVSQSWSRQSEIHHLHGNGWNQPYQGFFKNLKYHWKGILMGMLICGVHTFPGVSFVMKVSAYTFGIGPSNVEFRFASFMAIFSFLKIYLFWRMFRMWW